MGKKSSMVVKHTGVNDFSAWMEKFNNKDRMDGKKNTKAWNRSEVHYDPDTATVYVKHWHNKDDAAAKKPSAGAPRSSTRSRRR